MAIRVFISYSHDSSQHSERVWELSERLRSDGIDCRIDQHETWPEDGWPNWCKKQIKESNFVLVVCTATYLRRYEGNEEVGTGRGVKWEGFVITQELYEAEGKNKKFIPLVLAGEDKQYIPVELRAYPKYIPSEDEGYNELFRTLTNQPERRATPVAGAIRKLPTLMGKRDKKAAGTSTTSSSLPALPQIERKQDFSESGNGENGESRAYDVFLSHFEVDAAVVGVLGKRLTEEAQLRVWLDKWRSNNGARYGQNQAKAIEEAVSCAICLGKNTPRPWFDQQIGRALERRSNDSKFRVIPVILPGGDGAVVEQFRELRTWVEFKTEITEPEALHVLKSGVLGIAPGEPKARSAAAELETDEVRQKLQVIRSLQKDELISELIAQEFQRKLLEQLTAPRGAR